MFHLSFLIRILVTPDPRHGTAQPLARVGCGGNLAGNPAAILVPTAPRGAELARKGKTELEGAKFSRGGLSSACVSNRYDPALGCSEKKPRQGRVGRQPASAWPRAVGTLHLPVI